MAVTISYTAKIKSQHLDAFFDEKKDDE